MLYPLEVYTLGNPLNLYLQRALLARCELTLNNQSGTCVSITWSGQTFIHWKYSKCWMIARRGLWNPKQIQSLLENLLLKIVFLFAETSWIKTPKILKILFLIWCKAGATLPIRGTVHQRFTHQKQICITFHLCIYRKQELNVHWDNSCSHQNITELFPYSENSLSDLVKTIPNHHMDMQGKFNSVM